MPYIHFTEEQKLRASSVDLVEFLRQQGEKLIRSGREYRLESDHSITVRGNRWYDHAAAEGGGAISFVRNRYGLSYPEAVTMLLGGEQGEVYAPTKRQKEPEPKAFELPPAAGNTRRVYAYLLQRRLIDREVLSTFVREGLIYESCEPSKDGSKEYHNAVFVGKDEHGVSRHAHKRSLNDIGPSFRLNVEGCDPRFSFHFDGRSGQLYVFEAPIDMLSFISLHPQDWQRHSYVALCGTAEHAVLWMLSQHENINEVFLCLDHDAAGIEAAGRLAELIREKHEVAVMTLLPEQKDWNEMLKAGKELPAQDAEEHPQLTVAPEVCRRIVTAGEKLKPERWLAELTEQLEQFRFAMERGQTERAMEKIENLAAAALTLYGREQRQMGKALTAEELTQQLCTAIRPHQNRSSLKNRATDLMAELRQVVERQQAAGVRSLTEKQELADSWFRFAVSCTKLPVKYEADALREQQKAEKMMELAMGGL